MNVIDLSERRALRAASEPCAATIAEIEFLLERAKKGEIVGIAYTCATSNGLVGTGFEFGKSRTGFSLLAGAGPKARKRARKAVRDVLIALLLEGCSSGSGAGPPSRL